jgi:purine-binding chemotaxis protein CheW
MLSTIDVSPLANVSADQTFITFYLGDLLLGIDIREVQEITRNLEMTAVPHGPAAVQGVINLRGEVVMVVALRQVLGLSPVEFSPTNRNVIVRNSGEQIGLLVDRIADVVRTEIRDLDPMPENLRGLDHRFFKAVYKVDCGLLVILDVDAALAAIGQDN